MLIKQISFTIFTFQCVCVKMISRESVNLFKNKAALSSEKIIGRDIHHELIYGSSVVFLKILFENFTNNLESAKRIIALRSMMRVHSPRLYLSPFLKGKNRTSA